jgi:dTDP-4-dehydrorhamnose 3,5-epimerase
VPPGYAHGFCVLSEQAQVEYKTTDVYDARGELSVARNDPAIGISWPLAEPVLSDKDAAAPTLEALGETLPLFKG